MLFLTFRLVGDEDDLVFPNIIFEKPVNRLELLKRIETVTKIPIHYQSIKHRGVDIPQTLYPLENINDFEELSVEHVELSWWDLYKTYVDIALKPDRLEHAQEAVKIHARLMENGFFDVYRGHNSFQMQNHYQVASWADGNIQLMQDATKSHFRRQHFMLGANDESEFTCRFERRDRNCGGSRKNTIAFVKLHGEKQETMYNVKCHHFGSSINSAKGRSPDIKELFVYRLLQLINVGPEAQFILPSVTTGSKTSMYIATKWRDDFVSLASVEEEDVSEEILVQITLLGTFLFVDDLHSDNCGYWKGTKNAAVIDFMPKSYSLYTNLQTAVLRNEPAMVWNERHFDALVNCKEKNRLEMVKRYLNTWDLVSKIDMANDELKPQKDRMKQLEIGFKGFNSPTEELDQYISVVKENLSKLICMLHT